MAQEQVSVVLDLNQYGINKQLTISVPKTIEGVTYNEGDAFVPRNQIETNSVERIAGKVAGQSVLHCHIHLIPRREGDVENPQGGVRSVIPLKQHYKRKA